MTIRADSDKEAGLYYIKKRNGNIVIHNPNRIISAIFRAQQSLGTGDEKLATKIGMEVQAFLEEGYFQLNKVPTVEDVNDLVEKALMKWGLYDVAKAFIVYRHKRTQLRDQENTVLDVKKTVEQYLGIEGTDRKDWRVKENANQDFDYPGLTAYISGTHLAHYGLATLYPPEIAEAHKIGAIHVHDLSNSIVAYCAGWSLQILLEKGFGGVAGRISSKPPGHLDSVINQMITFLGTMQNEFAGAQAFSVHPKETIIVKDKNDYINISRIGQLFGKFRETGVVTDGKIEFIDISNKELSSLSFNKRGKHCWKRINKIIRHKISDPIHIVKTNKGIINVSENHSIFSLKNHVYLGKNESQVFKLIAEKEKLSSIQYGDFLEISHPSFLKAIQNLKSKNIIKNKAVRREDGTVAHSIYRSIYNNEFEIYRTADLLISKEVKSKDVDSNVATLRSCILDKNPSLNLYDFVLNNNKLREITRVYSNFSELKKKIQENSTLRKESLKISDNEKCLSYLLNKGYLPLELYEKLRKTYNLDINNIKLGKIRKEDSYSPHIKNDELKTIIKVIAWYISEGWSIGDYAVGFSQTKERNLDGIKELIKKLIAPNHLKLREEKKHEFIIGGYLGTLINLTCGKYCDNKKIPSFIFNLSNSIKDIFIKELIKGDGYKKSIGDVYTSTSNLLITGLNLILVSMGYRTSIKTRFENCYENNKIKWSTKEKDKLTRYDLLIHANEEIILAYEDFESTVVLRNEPANYEANYEYDLSIEDTETFIGGVGLFALHNSSVDTLLSPFIREKFKTSIQKILRQTFSLKANGNSYILLDTLYSYKNSKIDFSEVKMLLEKLYPNVIISDILLQTFLRSFAEEYKDNVRFVRQNVQNLIYAVNQTSRWGGQCVSEDTQCLTDNGWKYYNEIDKNNDRIATFSNGTHTVEYLAPQRINIHDYSGKMISLRNRTQDQLLTPNHRVVRKLFNKEKFVLISASELSSYKSRIQIPNSAPSSSTDEVEDHLVELIAWLVSEGSFSTGPRERVHIYQSLINSEYVDRIRTCLKLNGYQWDETSRIHGFGKHPLIRFRLNQDSSRKIRKIMRGKKIPHFIKKLSQRQLRLFLDIYIMGDGSVEENGRRRIYTKDEDVKDSLQEICVLAGFGSTIYKKESTGVYTINIIRNSITSITNISEEEFNGTVWCPTTPNGTFIARRKGKTFITGNSPFVNLSFDWTIPSDLAGNAAIIGGEPDETILYKDCQTEVDIFNKVFLEEMLKGDRDGRIFTFPIPTYSITKGFDWDHQNVELLMEITAKYGIPYFQNYSGTGIDPSSIRAMCCRLNLNLDELRSRPGGMWSIGDSTGSIGVATINLNRIGYASPNKEDFFRQIRKFMELGKLSLEIKRKEVSKNLESGIMSFARIYLPHGFKTYFSTIGLCGMHECCLNFLNKGIGSEEGQKFAQEILRFMQNVCEEFKKETGNLYNLEATPAESTSYRFARLDKKWYPSIITSGDMKAPYLTNSTQLPVDATSDIIEAIIHQNELQYLYTGGTIFHSFLGEQIDTESCKILVQNIAEKTKLPYFSITPTFSICKEHKYIPGEHFECPTCGKPTEVYSRIVGYFRPVQKWNDGKAKEFEDRKTYKIEKAINEDMPTINNTEGQTEIPTMNILPDKDVYETSVHSNLSNYVYLFTSPTCPQCGPFKRVLTKKIDEKFIKVVDTSKENNQSIIDKFKIHSIPSALVISEEKVVTRMKNVQDLNNSQNLISSLFE